ncbi:MAG TPA: SBBP repeat-containing protein, partial [Bryobacteraceae bacterium]|nr:SBBP repeat-containing protein [Bryobacteraceae bacterium]
MRAAFASDSATFRIHGEQIKVRFEKANRGVTLEGLEPLAAKANFFLGQDPHEWHTGVPTFQKILYRDLYPGIDLTYGGTQDRIKSEFMVAPGADPRVIRLEYSRTLSIATELSIAANGDLIARSAWSELRERAPEIFQETTAGRVRVAGRYRLVDDHTAGFDVDSYDMSLPLVIDPVISYSTYLGGTGIGAVTGLALDSGGNLYVTGWTEALDFPIVGATQAVNRGGVDVFVAKFNPTGTALVYATYIGGAGDDRGAAIAVDSSGQAYVTGSTASSNFPLAAAIRTGLGGSKTAFVLKLNAVGNTLLYSTYMGGSNWDAGNAIAVDGAANAYVAGDTQSADFPVLSAAQSTIGGGMDAFLVKLTSTGGLSLSTFLGGSGNEHAGGVAVDGFGNVYVAGGTYSTNYPVVAPIQGVNGGGQDAFVTKINAAGNSILYSTYLGGNGAGTSEQANAVAADSSGNAYVTGVTNSSNFPVTSGAYQTGFNGMQDAFITKINAVGNTLLYSTYLGGTSFDWASGIGLDSGGNAYVTGYTSSGDFATVNGVQAGFGGMYDAFVTELSATGNGLVFSTYFGGSGSDVANAIAVDGSGNMFVAGQTNSFNLPLQGPIQSSNNGGSTGWVARLGVTAPPPQLPSTVSVTPTSGSGNSVILTAQYSDTGGAAALTTVSLLVNTSASTTNACYVSYNSATNVISLANDSPSSGSVTVIPGGGSQQNSQCIVNGVGTSASISGSTLTLTVSLAFQPGFGGGKTAYLYAADAGANTGWISRGSWTVTIPPPQPSVDSVTPNTGLGAGQTFTFAFSDTQNASNLTGMAMLFSANGSGANACYIVYDRNRGTVALLWDNALGSDSKPLNSTLVLKNTQCSVGSTSSAFVGLSDIVTAAITFKTAFSGAKSIFMYAGEVSSNT